MLRSFMYTFLLLICCNTLLAQDAKINYAAKQVSATSLFEALQQQSGYNFLFDRAAFNNIPLENIRLNNVTLTIALNTLQKEEGFRFSLAGKNIAVKKENGSGRLSGKVIDEQNGEVLPGATIRIGSKGTITDGNGNFSISLPDGQYEVEVSAIGYTKKQVTEVVIKGGQTFDLNITLKRQKGQLATVTVRSSAKKESVASLLTKQKNAAEITNGISAEQISRTPDKHIGESLKRISGISTVQNKYVVVRGIGERYNAAMLDGTVLPSTEANSRNFSFDLIPSSLVDNVIVSKTITPDMNVSFGGGLIQINTKDIPTENFMSISGGVSFNDQTVGKDFYSRKRGKYDFLGFDDGHRGNFPADLKPTEGARFDIYEQSRKFDNPDNFTTYLNRASPSQNYQFTIGRIYNMDTTGRSKLGFTGSVSYRNSQSISKHEGFRRGKWNYVDSTNNEGAGYGFNTTWGALLNVGWQTGDHRFSFRNTYTRMFDNALVRTNGYFEDQGDDEINIIPKSIQETDDPVFQNLLQNKISGQHQLGKVKLEWDIARTSISRKEKDVVYALSGPKRVGKEYFYYYFPGSSVEIKERPISRSNYNNSETHYNFNVSASLPFNIGSTRNILKSGYAGNAKRAKFDWRIVALVAELNKLADSLAFLPVGQWALPQNMGPTGYFYGINPWYLDYYEGKSQSHAGFVMLDDRLTDQLRLVWGLRAEYFEYKEIRNPTNTKLNVFKPKEEPKWQFMPSANLTWSPVQDLNLRASWSNSVVRPELMDNSQFQRYSPYLDGEYLNVGLLATRITSYDVKAEWFPGAGEILSIGGFYKYFDKPVEMVANVNTGNLQYVLKNSKWAKVYGLELEARKNLGMIGAKNWVLFGNLTLQKSEVQSNYNRYNATTQKDEEVLVNHKRALYGQVPFLMNAGVQYTGDHFGLNIVYNKSGYKTHIIADAASLIERERPREQVDAQLSYRMLKNKLEMKLNAGNIFNTPFSFYRNVHVSERPDFDGKNYPNGYSFFDRFKYDEGYSDKYEEGDVRSFTQYLGRTFSFSLTYNF